MSRTFLVVWTAVKLDRSIEHDVEQVDAPEPNAAVKIVARKLREDPAFISARVVHVSEIAQPIEWTDEQIDAAVAEHERKQAVAAEQKQEVEAEAAQKRAAKLAKLKAAKS